MYVQYPSQNKSENVYFSVLRTVERVCGTVECTAWESAPSLTDQCPASRAGQSGTAVANG